MFFLILSYNRRQKAIHVYAKAKEGGTACAHCFEKILENSNINEKIDTKEAKPWIIDFGNRLIHRSFTSISVTMATFA